MKSLYESILDIDATNTTAHSVATQKLRDKLQTLLHKFLMGSNISPMQSNWHKGDGYVGVYGVMGRNKRAEDIALKKLQRFYAGFDKIRSEFEKVYGDRDELCIEYNKDNTTITDEGGPMFSTTFERSQLITDEERLNSWGIQQLEHSKNDIEITIALNKDKRGGNDTQYVFLIIIGREFEDIFNEARKGVKWC